MNYFLYILYSTTHNRTYTEQTNDLDNRLDYHNAGKVKFTKPYKPWVLIHLETFSSRAEAMKREKWFKSKAGRKRISEIIDDYLRKHSL